MSAAPNRNKITTGEGEFKPQDVKGLLFDEEAGFVQAWVPRTGNNEVPLPEA